MRHISRSVQGFTVLELVLLLVIVGLVGTVGYKIYNTNSKLDETLNNTEAVLNTPQSKASAQAELNQAEKSLTELDTSAADNEELNQLDSELSAF